jgi:hypothetical protein
MIRLQSVAYNAQPILEAIMLVLATDAIGHLSPRETEMVNA